MLLYTAALKPSTTIGTLSLRGRTRRLAVGYVWRESSEVHRHYAYAAVVDVLAHWFCPDGRLVWCASQIEINVARC